MTPDDALSAFVGGPCAVDLDGTELHHVALHLGDYETNDQPFRWKEFLERCHAEGECGLVAFGPSYVAAKVHGTEGWWFSTALGGVRVELFTCLRHGGWGALSADVRHRLMSHLALGAPSADRLEALRRGLCELPSVSLISFTERDSLGHTYGHFLHAGTGSVLEVVHDASR